MNTMKMITLAGTWKIVREDGVNGRESGWASAIPDAEIAEITVPDHIPNSEWTMDLSYSNLFPKYQGYVWYYKEFDVCPAVEAGERLLAEFERVAYVCQAFVNGEFVGEHRHQDKAFSFDITDKVHPGKTNLLAVRCFEPRALGGDVDGIRLCDLPNSCFAQTAAFALGSNVDEFCVECVGGILGSVHLRAVPGIRVNDVYVRSFWESGEVRVSVEVLNAGNTPEKRELSVILADKKSGNTVGVLRDAFEIPAGTSEFVLEGKIENHQLWELDVPALYTATVTLDNRDYKTVQFGFRDFRVRNGFFFLNGKRIFLKGAHGIPGASEAVTMKALGFNLFRTIARAFNEETLKICDEIGMLVMDAAATGWGMYLHKDARRQIEDYNVDMIKASRNHPCVVSYCLLNETKKKHTELISYFAESLPILRRYAPDTLFLFHSGRWDSDISLGSASNPGSDKWDTYFGPEGIPDYPNRTLPIRYDGYMDGGMGDIHVYMRIPVLPETVRHLRTLGEGVNPVFVSESGIGSQTDVMGAFLSHYGENLSSAITIDLVKQLWEETERFLDFYDLRSVYPLSCDFVRDTEKLNGEQRTLLYNIYRSNPMINGFSFTSVGEGNEGTYRGNKVVKESLAYAIQQGHEPLRWALFGSERVVYADRPFEIEAVLCNEDVLKPGKYSAEAYVRGADGCAWKKEFELDYPAEGFGGMPPLAATVLREQIVLPEGEYVFSSRLLTGGEAYDGDLPITVVRPHADASGEVTVLGISDPVADLLKRYGFTVKELCREDPTDPPKAVLVGRVDADAEERLCELAKSGSAVVFLDPAVFEENPGWLKKIAGENANLRNAEGTIYHNDNINVRHPVFEGINRAGVQNFGKFGIVYPKYLFDSVEKPTKTVCASMKVTLSFTVSGLTFGEYASGKGKFVLNTFRIAESVGNHPYADQMLLNIVSHYAFGTKEQ